MGAFLRRTFLKTAAVMLAVPVVGRAQQLVWRQPPALDREVLVFVRHLRNAMRQMFGEPDEARGLSVLDGTVLAAATTDTQVLAPATRAAGTYTSPTFTIPANILFLWLIVNVDIADKLAVGKSLALDVQHSPDGGINWSTLIGIGWTSWGPAGYHIIDKSGNPVDNPDPRCGLNPQTWGTETFRLVLTLPQSLTFGATVEVLT